MRAVAEVRRDAERIEAADVGVERVLIAEVVVADEELMLCRDDPVEPRVDPVRVLDRRRIGEQIGGNSDERRIGGIDGDRLRHASLHVLVGCEEEELVLDNCAARVRGEVVGDGKQGCGSGENRARD